MPQHSDTGINKLLRQVHDSAPDIAAETLAQVLELAGHAALPAALNPELLHLLRVNFLPAAPHTIEYDLLLSPLCHSLGDDLYEIDAANRTLLLRDLVHRHSSQRLGEVARLLGQYTHSAGAPWGNNTPLELAQRLTALSFVQPSQVQHWMERAEQALQDKPISERVWFRTLRHEIDQIKHNRWSELDRENLHIACAEMIASLNQELRWNLDETAQQRYLEELVPLLPNPSPDKLLRQTIQYYHLDHKLIAVLRDADHPSHSVAWEDARLQVLMTLKSNGFGDYTNGVDDLDDLVQIALVDLSSSLAYFRFASRLATWLRVVVLNSVRRTLRTQRAARRTAMMVPLDHHTNEERAIPTTAQPESLADYQLLLTLITTVLQTHDDKRLLPIFLLWAIDDQRLIDIGRAMQLSKASVSILLEKARRILREYLLIHNSWID